MKRFQRSCAFGLCLVLGSATAGPLAAQQAAPATDKTPKRDVQIPIQQFTLKNGMRLVLSEDHAAPTISLCLTYDVGSRNERPGRTGFAHLFEHLMFEGSQNVGKGEHMILVQNNGGDMNGTTSDDSTNYFERMPANQLDLALFLESDRMRGLNLSQPNLDNQRNAVQEEKRLRIDNQPYGQTFEKIDDLAYDNFAYKHSTMGSMADLNAASLEDVAAFFKTYYAPNNAVLSLVGDFKTAEALVKIKKSFEDIPAQPIPAAVDMHEPEQTAERRTTLEDAFARLPRLSIAYMAVPGNTPDWYALDMLGDLLFNGQSSRLYQKLVKDKAVALQVGGGIDLRRGPSLFQATATPKPGQDIGELEHLIYEEFESVKTSGVTQAEMDRVLAQDRRQQIRSLESTLGRARMLGENTVYFHDPNLVNTVLQKYDTVTAADIQRVARQYLVEAHRSVVLTVPKAEAQAAPAR
jgi:zinc protease